MKHTVGLMRENNLPSNGYELYFDEKPGMVRIRFFENLGPAEPRENEEQDDSVRFRFYDLLEFEQDGIEQYVANNLDWLKQKAKAEEEAALAAEVRAERDRLIDREDWRYTRHNSEVRRGLTPSDDIVALDTYIQALRDIPDQAGFPWNVEWPTE